nr:ribonuclease P protein component [Aerococcus tenax]
MSTTNPRPEIARLRKRREFLAAARAVKWAAPGLVLQALPRGDEAAPRIGFTVTRKVGIAVIRTRARRRLREAAREILPVHAKAGYDYVLVGRMATLTRAWPDLLDDLRNALSRVHNTGQAAGRPPRSHPQARSPESKDQEFHG